MGLIPCAVFLILIFHFTAFSPYGWTDFPLDDAWIHQVYSRSIAHGDGFQYNDGEQEAGSSSPLWSILTAPAHWLGGVFRHRWYGCSGKMRWGMLRYSDLAWDYLDHFCSDGIDAFGNHRGKFFCNGAQVIVLQPQWDGGEFINLLVALGIYFLDSQKDAGVRDLFWSGLCYPS